MSSLQIFILLIVVFLLAWFISVYNFFVASKARIKAAIQEIGNQLKRQADLIPNLEASVKGYLTHEKKIYQSLVEARKLIGGAIGSGDLQEMVSAGSNLARVLPNIQVLVESNPELKANGVVANLMDELRDTSDKVMYSRRLLIDLVADYNVKRLTFPSSLVAGIFGFAEEEGLKVTDEGEFLELKDSEKNTPKVNLDG